MNTLCTNCEVYAAMVKLVEELKQQGEKEQKEAEYKCGIKALMEGFRQN